MPSLSMLEFFQGQLRQPLFTGFLTASGFLFSVKAFLITNLYREIYATDDYQNHVKSIYKYDSRVRLCTPLVKLQSHLFYCIATTLVVSLAQLTIGFIQWDYVPYICYAFAILGFVAIGNAMYQVRLAMISWFEYLEETYGPQPTESEVPPSAPNDEPKSEEIVPVKKTRTKKS